MRGTKQGVGAHQVGVDKVNRFIDGAIHVAFRHQVYDRIRLVLGKNVVHCLAVANIGLLQVITGRVCHRSRPVQVAGISQLVDIDQLIDCIGNKELDQCRTDESGVTGGEYFHDFYWFLSS